MWRKLRPLGDGTLIARDAYAKGYRKFIAVGGDGTSYEVINGLFPEAEGRRAAFVWLFFHWVPAILSCETSVTRAWSTRWKPC